MNSLYPIVAVLIAIALVGYIGASLQQQAFAQGIIVDYKEEFQKLTDKFETTVSEAAAKKNMKEIQRLLDEYNRNFMMIFGLEPPDPVSDPPGDTGSSEDDDEPRLPGAR